jgi:hypothetical protein
MDNHRDLAEFQSYLAGMIGEQIDPLATRIDGVVPVL